MTDIILGGHTHTFMDEPVMVKNKLGQPVLINQVGWAGMMLGRLDVYFEKKKRNKIIRKENVLVH
jgi:5'-nucleotidase